MLDTIIALVLFILLLVTLELLQRAVAEVKRLKDWGAACEETYRLSLAARQRDTTAYRTMLAEARQAMKVTAECMNQMATLACEEGVMHKARIENLCEQLEESRKGLRHYYDEAATNANMVHSLNRDVTTLRATLRETQEQLQVAKDHTENLCAKLGVYRKAARRWFNAAAYKGKRLDALESELFGLKQASNANLSGLGGLTAIQQENKLDALCEVIKTLMQRGELCDSAVASFGGRLSRAVQVYRKDRKAAVQVGDDFNPITALLDVELAKTFIVGNPAGL